MSTSRRNEPISSWEDGDQVQGFALVQQREFRQDRNGKQYLHIELADQTGSIIAKAWSDSAAVAGGFEAPGFVAYRGWVRRYREQLQLNLDECRQATDEDRRYGFDESRLIPSTSEDIDDLWRRLAATIDAIGRPVLRRLGGETLLAHGAALREHPAAKAMHHAYRGGLLEHTVSMIELADAVCRHYADLDRDLVLLGVLFHDLGKLEELGAMPANEYTLSGRLVGHVVLGRDLLLARCAAIPDFPADLRLLLEHLVLSHQGEREYGAAVEPMTPEALVLHFIDDLDSKMNQFRRARRGVGPAGGMSYQRGLSRYVYLPGLPAADAEPVEHPVDDDAGDRNVEPDR
jgi:3'-5' exoribonuclease